MNAPAKISAKAYLKTQGGDTVDVGEVLGGISDAIEEVRAHLQKQIDSKNAFDPTKMLEGIRDALGDTRRDLQEQVDHLRDMARTREADWYDDLTEMKRVIGRMRVELDGLKKGKSHG